VAEVAKTAPKQHPVAVLREQLEGRIDTFRNALPPHIKPDRFIAAVITSVNINPDLLACDRRSLFMAAVRCAADGLMPDGTEAAIVPFKKTCTYMPMYQGLLKKFRNSGQFKWVGAGLAYEGEIFEHWIDEQGEHFKHVPQPELADPKKIRRVYAVASTKDGGFFVASLSMADINKRRNMSRASREDAPWKMWESEMMKKTAIRVLSRLLPKSSDLDAFVREDEEESLGIEHATAAIEDKRTAAFGSALDHFAGGEDEPGTTKPADGDAATKPAAEQTAAETAAAASPSNPPASDEALAAACALGREGFRNGLARRAVPPELREPGRVAEALAWTTGWDSEQAGRQ
jgi:recombination protein RecT